MGRDKKFSEPMPLPKGKKLATLRDDLTYAACRLSRCENAHLSTRQVGCRFFDKTHH
jgi:hypothetical protein